MAALPKPKQLTQSDAESRLCIPKGWWDKIRPLFGEQDDHKHREIDLRVVDGTGMFWEFRCSIRYKGKYRKPVLQSDGWLTFVNYKGLKAGDMVILETVENHFRGTRFMLRALKYDDVGDYWFDV